MCVAYQGRGEDSGGGCGVLSWGNAGADATEEAKRSGDLQSRIGT